MRLQVRSVAVARGGTQVLSNISFDAAGGEWIVLVGPNGAGKSSLLDVLAGIASPT
ncbi:ATP-binding cassette domain-containing protein, partial [Alicyclobacillus sendaiensis]